MCHESTHKTTRHPAILSFSLVSGMHSPAASRTRTESGVLNSTFGKREYTVMSNSPGGTSGVYVGMRNKEILRAITGLYCLSHTHQ